MLKIKKNPLPDEICIKFGESRLETSFVKASFTGHVITNLRITFDEILLLN